MKYILSSYGLNNPFISAPLPEHAVYPLALEEDRGLDLDYTSLLIGGGYSIDASAYTYICNSGLPFLAPMANSLRRLKESQLLSLIDVESIIADHRPALEEKTRTLAEDVYAWIPLVRHQWAELKSDRPTFQSKFGSPDRAFDNVNHATVLNALHIAGIAKNEDNVDKLTKIVERQRRRYTSEEEQLLRLIIQPLLAHILIYDLVRSKRGGIILDWDDSRRYYERLYLTRWDTEPDAELEIVDKARVLLRLTMPSLRANNVESVIRFVQDNRAVQSLRTEIIEAVHSGATIDNAWWAKYLLEVIRAQLHKEGVMKKVRFGAGLAGAFIPGGSILTELATEAATNVVEDRIEAAVGGGQHYWFYALQQSDET